jgi:hypothetical protein
MTIMGELGCVDVPGILQLLGSRNNTGLLWITADGEEVGLYLTGGALAQVTSSRLPLRLGRVLVQRGLITSQQLHRALRDQDKGEETLPLGELLVRRGWLNPDGLNDCIEEQCISVLARAIRARRGTFLFQPGVQPPEGSMTARLDSNRVLMEATRRVDELEELRDQLPPYYAPLSPSANVDITIQAFSDDEARILKALEAGADSLAELVDLLPMSERDVMINVIQMQKRGLVVAGHGAPGDHVGVPAGPPVAEADLARLLRDVDAREGSG